jgi:hypothetical protein
LKVALPGKLSVFFGLDVGCLDILRLWTYACACTSLRLGLRGRRRPCSPRLHQELGIVDRTRIGIPEDTVRIRDGGKLPSRAWVSRVDIRMVGTRKLTVAPLDFIRGSRRRDLECLVVRPGCHTCLLAAYVIQIGEIA